MLSTSKRVGPLVLGAAIVLAACGGGTVATTAPSVAAPTAPASVAAPSASDAGSPSASEAASAATGALTYDCTKGDGQLNGAGSTFIFPLLSKMGDDYNTKCGVKLNYQSIGSGGGVKAWTDEHRRLRSVGRLPRRTAEIAAAAANGEPVEIPVTFGAVVVAYNLKGLAAPLKMTPDIIAGHLPRQDHEVERSGDRRRRTRA